MTKPRRIIVHLYKSLQVSEEDYIDVLLYVAKHESQIKFCKEMMERDDFQVYDVPIQQLRVHVEKSQQELGHHQTMKEQLLVELPKDIADVVQRQCDYVIALATKEKIEQYKKYMEVLKKPIDILCSQQARLEFLQVAMATEKGDLNYHLSCVQSMRKQVEIEIEEAQQFSCQENANSNSANNSCIAEGSALHVVNSLLDETSSDHVVFVTPEDVQMKFEMLKLKKQNLITQSEFILRQQLNWISTMEKAVATLEDHVQGKDLDMQHPSYKVEALISSLKKLAIQIQHFEEKLLKEMKNYQKRTKLVTQNPYLAKARKLFIYALTNQAKFEFCVKELQEHVRACNDS